MIETYARKIFLGGLVSVTVLAAPNAHAVRYGELHITRNTVLRDHQYGSVVFDADDITLDCAGKQVHISSYSKLNCDEGYSKCGIVAENRSNITIKNCRVIGGFDRGVSLINTVNANVTTVESAGSSVGFWFQGTTRTSASDLAAAENDHGLVIDFDQGSTYSDITTVATTVGVYAWSCHDTVFDNIWTAYAEQGFSSYFLFDVTLRFIKVEAAWRGFFTEHSQRISLEAGSFQWLGGTGISLNNTQDSLIYENDSLNNEGMDVCQDQWSQGNSWIGNAFGDWCSSVPNIH